MFHHPAEHREELAYNGAAVLLRRLVSQGHEDQLDILESTARCIANLAINGITKKIAREEGYF